MQSAWALDPDVLPLNHGSYGATPTAVLAAQQHVRDRFEANPTGFVEDVYLEELDASRARLADFLGTDQDALAFVPNATTAVAAVVSSLDFAAGDEILVTDHAYNACRNVVDAVATRSGARVVVAPLAFPGASPSEAADAVLSRVTPRTRLVMVDHVTSPTALILPVEEIVANLEPDVPVLVDGAHAPGMLPLALATLDASFYAGNLHKWVCAPKGAGFLVVAERHRARIRPPVISHGWNTPRGSRSRFHLLFDWTGTFDPSAWLAVPAALETMAAFHPEGWPGVMTANRMLALSARRLLLERLSLSPPAPEEMIGSMVSVPLAGARPGLAARLRARGIVVAVPPWPTSGSFLLRVSSQRYNHLDQYARLVDAVESD